MKKSTKLIPSILIITSIVLLSCVNQNAKGQDVSISTQSTQSTTQTPKYIFLFIGDGMGFSHVAAAEAFLSTLSGVGTNISFTRFPVSGSVTTHSANSGITCSAAAATALSTGVKTNNGMICIDPSGRKLRSITYDLREAGYRIGIATSVSIDHATPAGFYAVEGSRDNYHQIARQIAPSGFDFFAGSGFLEPGGEGRGGESVYAQIERAGYTVVRTPEELARVSVLSPSSQPSAPSAPSAPSPSSPPSPSSLPSTLSTTPPPPQKVVITQDKSRPQNALSQAINREGSGNDGWELADFTRAGIRILDNDKGFFFMVEGGQIDWAAHANDAAAVIFEVVDFSKSVDIAVNFYKARPDETLILVTADHETGGMTLLNGGAPYTLAPGIIKRRVRMGKRVDDVDIKKQNAQAGIGWTTDGHTGVPVPIFALGAGSEAFGGEMDNTEIPKKIMGLLNGRF